jgi:Protein of unknown function (DUF1091)
VEKIEDSTDPKYMNVTYDIKEINGEFNLDLTARHNINSRRKLTVSILAMLHYVLKFHFCHFASHQVRIELFKQEEDGHYESFLINSTVGVCKFFKSLSQNMMLKSFYDKARSYGLLPTSCPLVAGTYYIKKYKLNGELLPPLFADTRLRANFELYYNDVKPVESITEFKSYYSVLKSF